LEVVFRLAGLWSSHSFCLSGLGIGCAGLETEAFIPGFMDVAVMGQPVEECGRHLASPKTPTHSLKLKLAVMTTLVHL
jgi:hypothetical protein